MVFEQSVDPYVSPRTHVRAKARKAFGGDEYTAPPHWSALAQELRNLGEDLDNKQKDDSAGSKAASMDGVFSNMLIPGSSSEYTTIEGVLQAFPPRPVADRLINIYFNSNDDPSVRL